MDYFTGLDNATDETHVCVLAAEGAVVYESKTELAAQAIANELGQSAELSSGGVRDRTNDADLFHRLNQLGLPVVCAEGRQAYQALKSLATHKTDPNDARGLPIAPSDAPSCTRCCETGPSSHQPKPPRSTRQRINPAPKRSDARGREQTTARIV